MGVCQRIFRAIKGQTNPPKHNAASEKEDPDKAKNDANMTKPVPSKIVAPKPKIAKADTLVASAEVVSGHEEQEDDNIVPKHGTRDHESNDAMNDKFSDFINRARLKLRSVSNVGAKIGKRPARTDSVNHKALDYINRAKIRIRSTSSNLGSGVKSFKSK